MQTASTTFLQFSFSCCVVKNMKSKIDDLVSTEKVYHRNLRNSSLMNDSNIWPLLSWSVWVLWPWRKCICTLDKNMDCIKRNSLNIDISYLCFCCLIRSLPNFDSGQKTLYRSNHLLNKNFEFMIYSFIEYFKSNTNISVIRKNQNCIFVIMHIM